MSRVWTQLKTVSMVFAGVALLSGAPVVAQGLESVDPDAAFEGGIDGDLSGEAQESVSNTVNSAQGVANDAQEIGNDTYEAANDTVQEANDPFADAMTTYNQSPDEAGADSVAEADAETIAISDDGTYAEDDLIGAAEGVFGKGAEGVARMIQDLLKKQGQPNAYIVGREAGGAFVVGARYGSGVLHHKVEGERKVYWTGPSIGFDAGANAGNTFVLVYNLFDTEELYERFPAGEGQAYFIGGLHASYVRKGDVVMIPIRVGAGLRLGVNAGYMRFSKKHRWLPF